MLSVFRGKRAALCALYGIATFMAISMAMLLSTGHPHAQNAMAQTTNGSVAITTGNTFQTALAAVSQNTAGAQNGTTPGERQTLTLANNNPTDSCWVYLGSGSATKAVSMLFLAGTRVRYDRPFVPSDTVQVTCATTADTFYIDYQ